jgi:uncharacterized protein YndB with AHSA1/START domain
VANRDGSIVREIHIAAPPEDVFPYFTDAPKMMAWKAVQAELDSRPGGGFRVDVTGRGDVARGTFLEIEAPHRVVFTWGWENDDPSFQPGSTVVEVTLRPDADGTLLRLVHRGVPEEAQERSGAGWEHYLARLALVAAGQDPGPDLWAAAAVQEIPESSPRRFT